MSWTPRTVDDVAVDLVITGSTVPLNYRERREVVRRLTEQGRSLRWIADRLGISPRSVCRHRRVLFHDGRYA